MDIGPMGGIQSSLEHVKTEGVVLLTCDMPLVQNDLLLALIGRLEEVDAVVPKDAQFIYPACAVYKTAVLKQAVDHCIKQGVYKLKTLLKSMKVTYYSVSKEESKCLVNLNSPDDVLRLLNRQ